MPHPREGQRLSLSPLHGRDYDGLRRKRDGEDDRCAGSPGRSLPGGWLAASLCARESLCGPGRKAMGKYSAVQNQTTAPDEGRP